MNALNRYLSFEIFLIHIGHGVLFWGVIAILAVELPWWLVAGASAAGDLLSRGLGMGGSDRATRGRPPLARGAHDSLRGETRSAKRDERKERDV